MSERTTPLGTRFATGLAELGVALLDKKGRDKLGTQFVNPKRILGIDPGLNTTGYGVIEIEGREIGGKMRLCEAGHCAKSCQGEYRVAAGRNLHR